MLAVHTAAALHAQQLRRRQWRRQCRDTAALKNHVAERDQQRQEQAVAPAERACDSRAPKAGSVVARGRGWRASSRRAWHACGGPARAGEGCKQGRGAQLRSYSNASTPSAAGWPTCCHWRARSVVDGACARARFIGRGFRPIRLIRNDQGLGGGTQTGARLQRARPALSNQAPWRPLAPAGLVPHCPLPLLSLTVSFAARNPDVECAGSASCGPREE